MISILGSRLMFRMDEMGNSTLKLFVPSAICQLTRDSVSENVHRRSLFECAARENVPMLSVSVDNRRELLIR
jgi:hypothetical protein